MKEKVKVLNIIGKRPKGGIGAVVYNYQIHMDSDMIQMDYLIFNDEPNGEFDEKVRKHGSTVYVLPELRNNRLFSIRKKIDEFFSKHANDYKIIHLHSANIGFICLSLAKKYGINNRIVHSHATMYSDKKINAIRNRILCMSLNKGATEFMACSKAAGEFLFGKYKEDYLILNNAIDCEKYIFNPEVRNKVRHSLSLNNKIVVGNVGRFANQKNHNFLIEIFYEVKKLQNDSVLLLIGDGELRMEIEAKTKDMGLSESVVFLGQRDDVPQLLQAMDVFVLPSLYEGLPVIGIEAQVSNLPCIFSDNITREVGIVDSTFISLSEHAKVWAEVIIKNTNNHNRRNVLSTIKNSGYDIYTEAKRLQEYYINLQNI
jgi:glycosyltransferase involved in cell wall biosynthesis